MAEVLRLRPINPLVCDRFARRFAPSKNISTKGPRTAGPSAPPDFLSSLWALASLVRLSLWKGAYVDVGSSEWQEIRVRSGRDDKGESRSSTRDSLLMERTADPSLPLPRQAGTGRFGRDDKGEGNGSWGRLPERCVFHLLRWASRPIQHSGWRFCGGGWTYL